MKPAAFDYLAPTSLDEACATLTDDGSDVVILAGGQSLVPLMNLRMVQPDVVLDLNGVVGLDAIEETPSGVRIGATARLHAVAESPLVRSVVPVLAEAIGHVSHPQIRARSTMGGTMCHADPAAEVPAIAVATGARVILRSTQGERRVDAADFVQGFMQTDRQPGELCVAVEFDRLDGFTFAFEEIARRPGDFALAGLCLGVARTDGTVTAARAAALGIGSRPERLTGIENALVGAPLADSTEATSAAVAAVEVIGDDAAHRRALLRTLLRTATTRLEASS